MALPHTLLTIAAIAGLWWGGHLWCISKPALQPAAKTTTFAIFRSAYGSMFARMMKDSLYSYWHDGQSATTAAQHDAEHGAEHGAEPGAKPAPSPIAGRLGRLGRPPLAPVAKVKKHKHVSWLDARVEDLARLETLRTKRNSAFRPSAAHRRYINASADWRLRLAYQLDPGDSTLYEILNFHLQSQRLPPDVLKPMLRDLAHEAIYHALGERTGVNEALTGAGAAANLLNEQLMRKNNPDTPTTFEILRNWKLFNLCLERYRNVRQDGMIDGWWQEIPEVRQQEIEVYAKLLHKIAETMKKQLVEMKLSS